jgi:hypothetical protein
VARLGTVSHGSEMAAEVLESRDARERAKRASTPEVVMLLRAILGPQLVLSIAGARAPSCVTGWSQGHGRPSSVGEVRLRIALELALVILEGEGLEAASSWLVRRDPRLEGRSPLGVLAEEPPRVARETLLAAARQSLREGDVTRRLVRAGASPEVG